MGRNTDFLRILSMNASGRDGVISKDFRNANLRDIVENERPDIMFLPGDNTDPDTLTQTSYQQLLDPAHNETVLLYDSTRLTVQPTPFKSMSCDVDKVLAQMVDVFSPAPTNSVVKKFICVSWHWKLTVERGSQVLYENGRQIMLLAQYLALKTETEVLIGGDFNLPMDAIRALVTDHNNVIQNGIDNVKPMFEELGYLDCMTENIHRPGRRLRQLKIHTCKSQEKVTDTGFFVASKEMQLMETTQINLETMTKWGPQLNTIGRPTYCPVPSYTKTQMYIPSRPPKHHGG